jgi:hypothetical protein
LRIFQGKYLPCFVATSPKASITPEVLADMLGAIYSVGLYDRTNGCMLFVVGWELKPNEVTISSLYNELL